MSTKVSFDGSACRDSSMTEILDSIENMIEKGKSVIEKSPEEQISTLMDIEEDIDLIRESRFHTNTTEEIELNNQLVQIQDAVSDFNNGRKTLQDLKKTISTVQVKH